MYYKIKYREFVDRNNTVFKHGKEKVMFLK